jgi:hypothetical protein
MTGVIVVEEAPSTGEDCESCPEDCGPCPDPNTAGCADGSREGFLDEIKYPLIAGCAGGWDIPGLHHDAPACSNQSGNGSDNPFGQGCNVEDLCSEGWHVCYGPEDVAAHSDSGCTSVMDGAEEGQFFAVRSSSVGGFECAPDADGGLVLSTNDLFGCGDLGCPLSADSCGPLQRGSHDLCKSLNRDPTPTCDCSFAGELPPDDPGFIQGDFDTIVCSPSSGGCGWCQPLDYFDTALGVELPETWQCGNSAASEANNVRKSGPELGGVLCCEDL